MTPPRPHARPHTRRPTGRLAASGLAVLTGLALVASPRLPAQAADPGGRTELAETTTTLLVTGDADYVVPPDRAGSPNRFSEVDLGYSTVGPDGQLWVTKSQPESGYPAGLYRVESPGELVPVLEAVNLTGLTSDAEGLVFAQTRCRGEDETRRRTRLVRYDIETGTQTEIADGLTPLDGIALEPDGDVVGVEQAVEGCDFRVFTRQGLVRVAPDGQDTRLASDLRFPTDVAVAPDGSYLVTSSGWPAAQDPTGEPDAGALLRIPAAGGEPSVVAPVAQPQGLDLSPDGTVWTAGFTEGGSSAPRSGVVQRVAPDGEVTDRLLVEEQVLDDVSTFGEDPVLSAAVSSPRGRNAAGWYRTPVTVRFTCAEGSTPLEGDCPAPVVLRNADRALERTITATGDGGSDSVSVRVKVDTAKPTLRTRLVGEAPYAPSARPVRCSATDGLSGVAGDCTVSYGAVRTRANGSRFRTWTASVRDVAGNRTTRTGSFGVRR
ncbi:hypothetical protein [uncultured Nocardioides sp.]|uniref:SMP-30/gluconolactonase/LRE family protein n=1 Tax=uncultured Nocardioides sp. TaxID=198441 RepID=UPI002607A1EE|nr:hypothetical protein [uncultured Nocardioides sp.]